MFFMTCETQQKTWRGLPRRLTKLIEYFQREYLHGYFQSVLFPHLWKNANPKGKYLLLHVAWWDLLLCSWLQLCRGEDGPSTMYSHTCGGRGAGQGDAASEPFQLGYLNPPALVRTPNQFLSGCTALSLQ